MALMRLLYAALALLFPASAAAHIHLTAPLARTDSLTGDQKDQHCGVANQQRTTRVTTFKPGETITVTWMETIQHPGYFRVAFQPDGSTFHVPPSPGNGAFPTEDLTGMTDAATGTIILKDRIPDGTLSTQVTLPNMECNNCTLQFIQVMTDKAPYTTDPASDDIYFNCADITLANDAPMPDAGNGGNNGGPDGGGGGGGGPSATSGGCSTSGGGVGLAFGLSLLGLAVARRRRR